MTSQTDQSPVVIQSYVALINHSEYSDDMSFIHQHRRSVTTICLWYSTFRSSVPVRFGFCQAQMTLQSASHRALIFYTVNTIFKQRNNLLFKNNGTWRDMDVGQLRQEVVCSSPIRPRGWLIMYLHSRPQKCSGDSYHRPDWWLVLVGIS